MKGLAVTALSIAFGVVAYDKLIDMINVIKHLIT
jgi:hypothetical protein